MRTGSVPRGRRLLSSPGAKALDEQVRNSSSQLQYTTNIIGTMVSGVFLFLIAAINIVILAGIVRMFRDMRAGRYDDEQLEEQLNKRGLMNRFLGPLARRIDAPWKMYPIGFLFGLGFDTATEVALLVLAGTAVIGGLPFYAVLSLPILFAAGMSLFDTADGCFMNFAYDWAFARPVRKVYYNLTITALSVFVAVFIGAVEVLGLLGQDGNLTGPGWSWVAGLRHQQGRFRDRRCVRADLGGRLGHLALRQDRAEVGPRRQHPGQRLGSASWTQEQARRRLRAERAEVERLLGETTAAGREDRETEDEQGVEFDDPAQSLTAEGEDDAIAESLRDRLAAIGRAEQRLANGTYGRSVRSGLPIPDARLEADPAAELTVEEAAAH